MVISRDGQRDAALSREREAGVCTHANGEYKHSVLVLECNPPLSARACCAHARALSGQQRFRNHGTDGDGLVLDQDEADEAHALATSLAEKFGGSLGVIIAHMRWPHHLADA